MMIAPKYMERWFSMGIDCPYIQQVIHYWTPSVPEQYVQEIRRVKGMVSSQQQLCFLVDQSILKTV